MEEKLEKAITEIHTIASKLPPSDALMVLRFLPSRADWKTKDVVDAWKADRSARAEAEMQKRERLQKALEGASPGDIEAAVRGVAAEGKVN